MLTMQLQSRREVKYIYIKNSFKKVSGGKDCL